MDEKRIKVPLVVVITILIIVIIAIFCVSGPHSSPIWKPKILAGNRRYEFQFLNQNSNDNVNQQVK
jgi:hypothetical protein